MNARRPSSRLAVLAFVCALVLKGAIPLFASWSAHLQGKGVAEVCDVYGIALPGQGVHDMHAMHGMHTMKGSPSPTSGDEPRRHEPAGHSGDHCVLGALVAFAGDLGGGPTLPVAQRRSRPIGSAWTVETIRADSSARWAARLGHGPPALS
ncbi:MAG: hypothetical protein ABI520_11290 [Caldimonas sp.]